MAIEIAKLVIKNSSVPGAAPDPAFLDYGELLINFADGKLFYKDDNNVIQFLNAGDLTEYVTLAGDEEITGDKTFTGVSKFYSVDMNVQTLKSGSIEWDCSLGNFAEVLLTGDSVLQNLTNVKKGSYILRVRQDDVGGHTLTFGSNYRTPGGALPELVTDPGTVSILTILKGTTMGLYLLSQTDFQPIVGGPTYATDTDDDDSPDDDQDGTEADAFPDDIYEWLDSDGDGVGDNADTDPYDPAVSGPELPGGEPSLYWVNDSQDTMLVAFNVDPLSNDITWYGTDPIPDGSIYKGEAIASPGTYYWLAPRNNDVDGQWCVGFESGEGEISELTYSQPGEPVPLGQYIDAGFEPTTTYIQLTPILQ